MKPLTGFFKDGCCNTTREDTGGHTVCTVMTAKFLEFPKSCGNDLSAPMPEFGLPGQATDGAYMRRAEVGSARGGPGARVVLRATHQGALDYCALTDLKRFAVDLVWETPS
jgi:uncharacterized protein (DUF2237 family)